MMNPALCNSLEVRSDAFHDVRTVAPCVLLRNYRKKHLYNANNYILTVSLITLAFLKSSQNLTVRFLWCGYPP